MLRFIYCVHITLFIFISIFVTDASDADTDVDSSSVIQVNDGLLTVKVKDVPFIKVMEEITELVSIKSEILVSGEELITADITSMPVEDGLKQLLGNYNYTFVKGTEKSKGGGNEIRKIIILSMTGTGSHRTAESTIVTSEEPSFEPPDEEPFDEDLDILNEDNIQDTFKEESGFVTDLKETPSIESLSEDLRDEDTIKRVEAVLSLGELDDETSVSLLTDALRNDKDDSVRMMAADSLGSIGNEEAVEALRVALQDGDSIVGESAIFALSLIGGDKAIEALESALPGANEDMKAIITEELKLLKEQ